MSRAREVLDGIKTWTGDEQPGKNRPVGVRGDQLDWHRTQVVREFLKESAQ